MAGRVDEGDLGARRRRDLVGADVLGDAARLAAGHVGGADGVEQRRLAVIDMAHDGHHRRPRMQLGRVVGLVEQAFLDVGFGDPAHRVAEFLGDQLGGVGVDDVGDLEHLPLLHQQLDHVHRALGHAVGELLDGDDLRDRHLAHQLFLGLVGGMPLGQALHAAAERRHRALALLIRRERGDQGEPAAALFRAGPGRFRGRCGSRRAAGSPHRARALLFIGFLNRSARAGRNRGNQGCRRRGGLGLLVLAEALLGFGLRLALGLFVVAAALVLLALARLGGLAFDLLAGFPLVAPARILFGDPALLGFADLGIGERMGAGAALLLGQGAQHDARRLAAEARGCTLIGGRRRGPAARHRRPAERGRGRRGSGRRLGLGLARADHAAFHLFDHHRLGAAMTETLTHHPLLDAAALERQGLGRGDGQRLAGVLLVSHYDPGSSPSGFGRSEPEFRSSRSSARKHSRIRQRARNVSPARPASSAACTTFRRPNAKSN